MTVSTPSFDRDPMSTDSAHTRNQKLLSTRMLTQLYQPNRDKLVSVIKCTSSHFTSKELIILPNPLRAWTKRPTPTSASSAEHLRSQIVRPRLERPWESRIQAWGSGVRTKRYRSSEQTTIKLANPILGSQSSRYRRQ